MKNVIGSEQKYQAGEVKDEKNDSELELYRSTSNLIWGGERERKN